MDNRHNKQLPEHVAVNIMETIDDHHGSAWSEESGEIPEWLYIEVHGCALKDPIKSVLEEHSIVEFETTTFGFIGKDPTLTKP
jgi:hypothetical protein